MRDAYYSPAPNTNKCRTASLTRMLHPQNPLGLDAVSSTGYTFFCDFVCTLCKYVPSVCKHRLRKWCACRGSNLDGLGRPSASEVGSPIGFGTRAEGEARCPPGRRGVQPVPTRPSPRATDRASWLVEARRFYWEAAASVVSTVWQFEKCTGRPHNAPCPFRLSQPDH